MRPSLLLSRIENGDNHLIKHLILMAGKGWTCGKHSPGFWCAPILDSHLPAMGLSQPLWAVVVPVQILDVFLIPEISQNPSVSYGMIAALKGRVRLVGWAEQCRKQSRLHGFKGKKTTQWVETSRWLLLHRKAQNIKFWRIVGWHWRTTRTQACEAFLHPHFKVDGSTDFKMKCRV